jgi:Fe-S cluster assembly iron-binding protein IscA
MLQLTPPAARILADVRREQQIPAGYGVRLSGRLTADGDLGVQIAFAEAPAPNDTVDEQLGTKLFIADEVAEPLSHVALDVTMNVAGNGSTPVRLVVRPQPPGDERSGGDG